MTNMFPGKWINENFYRLASLKEKSNALKINSILHKGCLST